MRNFNYPKTQKKEFKQIIHGVEIVDQYKWMENFEDEAVRAWIKRQNDLTDNLIPESLRSKLEEKILPLLDMETESSYLKRGEYVFFTRRIKGKNQRVLIAKNLKKNTEKTIIDPNRWSVEGTIALDWFYPSPKGNYIAYGKSSDGSEWSTLHIVKVESGDILAESIPRARWVSLAWEEDEKGFYYTRYPKKGEVPDGEENYNRILYHHQLGQKYEEDEAIIDNLRKKEEMIDINRASDKKRYLISRTIDWAINDLYILEQESKKLYPLCDNLNGKFFGDCIDDSAYLFTDYEAPKGRIIKIGFNDHSIEKWITVIAESDKIIRNMILAGKHIIIQALNDVKSELLVYGLDGTFKHKIKLPTIGSVSGLEGNWDDEEIYFSFESFFYPHSIFKANVNTGKTEIVHQPNVDIDYNKYETKQEWFKSKDGTRVPMFIVKNKETSLTGTNPVYLTGYGGFDATLVPYFSHLLPIMLENGIIFALPNLRGGGEFGKEWHLAGRKENKQNVFDDFISAAEWLIEKKYSSPEHIIISGGSNGGLLVGAALVQRPDLFKGVICRVPLLDMIYYHKFHVANIWSDEYGSAENPEEFSYLYAYSPYHNAKRGKKYPATLFTTAESDTRVHPMHAIKMTALMQELEQTNPILLQYEFKAGHGAGKPLKKIAETYAYILAFTFWQLGLAI